METYSTWQVLAWAASSALLLYVVASHVMRTIDRARRRSARRGSGDRHSDEG